MVITDSPCSRLLSSNDEDHYREERNAEHADVTMRARESIERVARRFTRRKIKLVVGMGRRVVLACVVELKRKVCRILNAKTRSSNERHVFLNYDMCSYTKNFDDGRWQQEEVEYYKTRSFAFRYGQANSLAL